MSKEDAPQPNERAGYIGGSDAATILGLSPFGASPFSLFVQKRGYETHNRVIDEALAERFAFGHAVERLIAERFSQRTGLIAFRPSEQTQFMRHKEHAFLGGHLDFWVKQDEAKYPHAILECKNIEFRGDDWNDPNPEGDNAANVALYYLTQCDHYMALAGVKLCYLGVLFGGCKLLIYPIYRNLAREAILLEAERRFWRRVLDDDPPDFASGIDDLTIALRAKYVESFNADEAKKAKAIIQVDEGIATLLTEIKAHRRKARHESKEAEAKCAALTLRLHGQTGYFRAGDEKWGSLLMQDKTIFDDFGLQMKYPEIHAEFTSKKRIGPVLRLTKDQEDPDTTED